MIRWILLLKVLKADAESAAQLTRCAVELHAVHPGQANCLPCRDRLLEHRGDVVLAADGFALLQLLAGLMQEAGG